MKIVTNSETIESIKNVAKENPESPKYVRVFLAGAGWGGPSLGLTLDELKETDLEYSVEELAFIMDKELYDSLGDVKVEATDRGYIVKSVNAADSDCSSCSGSC